jgi:hypothetical protein
MRSNKGVISEVQMTYEGFVDEMSHVLQEAQARLHKASRGKPYSKIPHAKLVRLYERYRNVPLNTPNAPFALVACTFLFTDFAINNRMNELIEAASDSSSWPRVVDRCREELNACVAEVIDDMDHELEQSASGI